MEKFESRIGKSVLAYNILFFIIICICTILYFFINNNYRMLKEENKYLSTKIKENNENVLIYSDDISKLTIQLDLLKNIESKIYEKKQSYSDNIRKLEEEIIKGNSTKKIAYITIDDGPYQYTNSFLDVLKEYNAKATFFVLLKPNRLNEYKRIVSEGHVIANHTSSHNLKQTGIYSSSEAFINDINRLNSWLEENIGVSTTLFRFPGGSLTAGKLKLNIANSLKEKGYNYVDWNVIVGDGSDKLIKQKRPYEWFKEQIKDKKIALILMHDYCKQTLEDLPKILNYLKENDYLILPLTNKSIMVN